MGSVVEIGVDRRLVGGSARRSVHLDRSVSRSASIVLTGCRATPHSWQNFWCSEASTPQLGHCMVETVGDHRCVNTPSRSRVTLEGPSRVMVGQSRGSRSVGENVAWQAGLLLLRRVTCISAICAPRPIAWLSARSQGHRLPRADGGPRSAPVQRRSRTRPTARPRGDRHRLGRRRVVRQSERFDRYEDAISTLEGRGLVYECFCTRREIRDEIDAARQRAARSTGFVPGNVP